MSRRLLIGLECQEKGVLIDKCQNKFSLVFRVYMEVSICFVYRSEHNKKITTFPSIVFTPASYSGALVHAYVARFVPFHIAWESAWGDVRGKRGGNAAGSPFPGARNGHVHQSVWVRGSAGVFCRSVTLRLALQIQISTLW